MSKNMTLREVKEEKKKLENAVFNAVNEFQENTGLLVRHITVDHIDLRSYKDQAENIGGVHTEVSTEIAL